MYEIAPFYSSRNWRKNSTVQCGSGPIKIHYFGYLKRFMNKINKVYDFSIKYRYAIAIFY